MSFPHFPLLSLTIFFPLAAAGGLLLLRDDARARLFALASACLELALAAGLLPGFEYGTARMQYVERATWIPSLNIQYEVGLDGLSILFPVLTALLTLAVILASWNTVRTQTRLYLALLFVLESATVGVFGALDLALFFLFWELTLIPIFFLISLWGIGPQRRLAAVKYTLFMLAGGVPLLFGFVLLAFNHAEQMDMIAPRGLCFDYLTLIHVPVAEGVRTTLFFLFLLGFGVKAPIFPFHTWLPTVAMEGPVGIAALLTGLKLGLYGLLRIAIPLVPEAAREQGALLSLLGTVGIVYGALIALRQTNLRRLLAYSSISHAGFVVLGLASYNVQGVQGAVLQLANFAVVSGGFFLLAGFLHHRLGSTDLASLGGVAKPMPMLAAFLFVLGLAAMGVPGTSGFAAEHLILLGAFQAHTGAALVALFGVVLGAAYFLGCYQRAFLGPIRLDAVRQAVDLRPRELAVAVVLALLVLAGGWFPQLLIGVSRAQVQAWVVRVHTPSDSNAFARMEPAVAGEPAFPEE